MYGYINITLPLVLNNCLFNLKYKTFISITNEDSIYSLISFDRFCDSTYSIRYWDIITIDTEYIIFKGKNYLNDVFSKLKLNLKSDYYRKIK